MPQKRDSDNKKTTKNQRGSANNHQQQKNDEKSASAITCNTCACPPGAVKHTDSLSIDESLADTCRQRFASNPCPRLRGRAVEGKLYDCCCCNCAATSHSYTLMMQKSPKNTDPSTSTCSLAVARQGVFGLGQRSNTNQSQLLQPAHPYPCHCSWIQMPRRRR